MVSLLTFLDEFPSAPHKPGQLVLRTEREIMWRHAKRIVDFRTEEEAENVSLSLLAAVPRKYKRRM